MNRFNPPSPERLPHSQDADWKRDLAIDDADDAIQKQREALLEEYRSKRMTKEEHQAFPKGRW